MDIIPAIDLSDGQCVRLKRGDIEKKTVYSDNPAEFAKRWQELGATILHVVDLDGAMSGQSQNIEAIERICRAVDIPVELGGGLRTPEDVGRVLDIGVRWAIMGTSALKDRAAVEAAISDYPGSVIVGIDARDGYVAVAGWVEESRVEAVELARQLDSVGAAKFIFTDIATDGMMEGPNIASTRQFAQAVKTPVIASGGISSLDDVKAVRDLEPLGVTGMIIGRALYEGTIKLDEAIEIAG
ncbi:MAG: 1-(5-phosphoribosyl)-5-[(5-phosphoribosylamino)methylideneamino]imidazole-4-carboxamide isomerase [Armatimonadota bacterium]